MNYIDLFSGIGGFALGAYWAGIKFENHFNSDIEDYANKVYKLRFPDSIQLGDITKINFNSLKNQYGNKWIITGGFPCQDISMAGKGRGLIDEQGNKTRSGLWFEMWRCISVLRPEFAIMENVGAITFRGLAQVLQSLHEIGYNAEWQDIRASDVGAPHKRERIWIIAYPSKSIRRNGRDNREKRCFQNDKKWKDKKIQSEGNELVNRSCKICDFFSNPHKVNVQRIKQKYYDTKRREKQNKRQAGLCNRTRQWETEPSLGRLANGIPSRVDRLKGLGNAIVPQIAEILFKLIKDYIN